MVQYSQDPVPRLPVGPDMAGGALNAGMDFGQLLQAALSSELFANQQNRLPPTNAYSMLDSLQARGTPLSMIQSLAGLEAGMPQGNVQPHDAGIAEALQGFQQGQDYGDFLSQVAFDRRPTTQDQIKQMLMGGSPQMLLALLGLL